MRVFASYWPFEGWFEQKRREIGVELPNAAIPYFTSLISGRIADHHSFPLWKERGSWEGRKKILDPICFF
jgi:hypothetical protein